MALYRQLRPFYAYQRGEARRGDRPRTETYRSRSQIGVSEPTKTGDYRYFRLSDELVRRFRLYPPRALQWGKNAGEFRLFGYADTKGPVPIWKAICEKAGLRYFSPCPAGRKSFATTLISKGKEDLKTTAALGNWKDVRILLEHHVDPYGMDEIFERNFEGLLARNWQDQNPHESQVIVTKRKKPKMRTESLPPAGGRCPAIVESFWRSACQHISQITCFIDKRAARIAAAQN
jgi:hypothetical protein